MYILFDGILSILYMYMYIYAHVHLAKFNY